MKHLLAGLLLSGLLVPSVAAAYGPLPSIEEFYATSSFVDGEQRVSLFWSAENADGCQIRKTYRVGSSGAGSSYIATVESDGVYVVTQAKTTEYELFCTNEDGGGIGFDSETVKVSAKKPRPLPTCTLSAKPSLLFPGQRATIAWKTRNAKEVRWQQDTGANVLGLPSKKLRKSGKERVIFAGKGDQTIRLNLKGRDGTSAWCSATLRANYWNDF